MYMLCKSLSIHIYIYKHTTNLFGFLVVTADRPLRPAGANFVTSLSSSP